MSGEENRGVAAEKERREGVYLVYCGVRDGDTSEL
jgi:hypothetical protein